MKVKDNLDDNEEGFRVSVCLRQFFDDERAQCYMWVSRSRTVRSLRRRLRQLFPLPRRLALRCRGHLLPPAEPLALLRPDDAVEVIPLSDKWNWAYRKKNTETCEEAAIVPDQSIDSTNNKSAINELEADNYSNKKSDTMVAENPSDSDVIDGNAEVAFEDRKLTQVKEQALALLQNYEVKSQTIDMFPKGGPKRVRRRVRRRKPRLVQSTMNVDSLDSSAISDQSNQTIFQSQISVNLSGQVTSMEEEPDPPVVPLLVNSSLPLAPNIYREVIAAPNIVRNDAAIPRKARIVRPLDSEIIHSVPHNLTLCHDLQANESLLCDS